MEKVAKFEKVSYEEYEKAMKGCFEAYAAPSRQEELRRLYDSIELPRRATSGSAGYDVSLPFSVLIEGGKTMKIPTGIRAKINDGWWMAIVPRSSLGFRYRLQLDNTVAVIDSDYYDSDNEGHIYIKITNDSKAKEDLFVEEFHAICQAIFLPYGIVEDDDADAVRNGGMGSTDEAV